MTPSERLNLHLKDRRRKGYCGYFGCVRKSGDAFYCEEHRRRHAEEQRRRRQERRAHA